MKASKAKIDFWVDIASFLFPILILSTMVGIMIFSVLQPMG